MDTPPGPLKVSFITILSSWHPAVASFGVASSLWLDLGAPRRHDNH
jgi:hypothetical protein